MRFSALTGQQIDQIDREMPVLLPVARTVPRGPGLPVGMEAKVLEDAVSLIRDQQVLLLPTPPFAASPMFAGFTGRLSIAPSTFASVISDILNSVLSAGFRRVLVLSVEESLCAQTLFTLQSVRAENPTSLLFTASLQGLCGADSLFIGHIAAANDWVGEFDPRDIDLPLTPSVPEFIPLNQEISTSGSIMDPCSFNRKEGLRLRELSRQKLESLLQHMSQPVTFR